MAMDRTTGIVKILKELTAKVAATVGRLLFRHRGRVVDVAREVGGTLLAPYIDAVRTKDVWGKR